MVMNGDEKNLLMITYIYIYIYIHMSVMNGDEKHLLMIINMSFRCFRFLLGKNECSRLSHQADAVEILGFCMRSISSTLLESCVLTSSPSTWMP